MPISSSNINNGTGHCVLEPEFHFLEMKFVHFLEILFLFVIVLR